jgi:hypothetical protein
MAGEAEYAFLCRTEGNSVGALSQSATVRRSKSAVRLTGSTAERVVRLAKRAYAKSPSGYWWPWGSGWARARESTQGNVRSVGRLEAGQQQGCG